LKECNGIKLNVHDISQAVAYLSNYLVSPVIAGLTTIRKFPALHLDKEVKTIITKDNVRYVLINELDFESFNCLFEHLSGCIVLKGIMSPSFPISAVGSSEFIDGARMKFREISPKRNLRPVFLRSSSSLFSFFLWISIILVVCVKFIVIDNCSSMFLLGFILWIGNMINLPYRKFTNNIDFLVLVSVLEIIILTAKIIPFRLVFVRLFVISSYTFSPLLRRNVLVNSSHLLCLIVALTNKRTASASNLTFTSVHSENVCINMRIVRVTSVSYSTGVELEIIMWLSNDNSSPMLLTLTDSIKNRLPLFVIRRFIGSPGNTTIYVVYNF
jgi:hypothetical protein